MCLVCDQDSHWFIDTGSEQLVYSESFCWAFVTYNIDSLHEIYNDYF